MEPTLGPVGEKPAAGHDASPATARKELAKGSHVEEIIEHMWPSG